MTETQDPIEQAPTSFRPIWAGTPFDHNRTIADINSSHPFLSDEDMAYGWRLYKGDQWSREISVERAKKNRPTLTVNFIPKILWRAYRLSVDAGHDPSAKDIDRAAAILGLENRDAQTLWNYQVSALAELSMCTAPKIILDADIIDTVQGGTTFLKPSRRLHKNWFVRVLDRITRWIDERA